MDKNLTEKERLKQAREARLAQNLRDNLRRRKAATRKVTKPDTATSQDE